jgi:predicted RNase H-like nuclease (RuvC/YqgF family)
MGPEYIAIGLTAVISAVSGGSWVANKLLERSTDRVRFLSERLDEQDERIDDLEIQLSRMPVEYVLKADFIREIQEMQENFRQINNKLDKLIEKLLSK